MSTKIVHLLPTFFAALALCACSSEYSSNNAPSPPKVQAPAAPEQNAQITATAEQNTHSTDTADPNALPVPDTSDSSCVAKASREKASPDNPYANTKWACERNWRKLRVGMAEDQVIGILGTPTAHPRMGNDGMVLRYDDHRRIDGSVRFDKSGKVVAWNQPNF